MTFADGKGSADELQSLPGVAEVRHVAGTFQLYTETPGWVAVETVRYADSKKWELIGISTRKPSLEEVYIHITNQQGKSK